MIVEGPFPQALVTRLQGKVHVRFRRDGKVILAKWPKKRGQPKSPTTRQQVAIWDLVLALVKAAIAQELEQALKLTGGTAYYAKDILIAAAYGEFIAWIGWGWKYKPPG